MFENRKDAAEKLAQKLIAYKNSRNTVIIGLPRGGMVIAKVLSDILSLPLGIITVKKISAPNNPELAIGAVAEEGTVYWDESLIKELRLSHKQKKEAYTTALNECRIRMRLFGERNIDVQEKTCVIVDDGVATGSTVCVASLVLAKLNVNKRILATPVITSVTLKRLLLGYYEKVIYIYGPSEFHSVSEFYNKFPQVTNSEVLAALHK